MTDSGPQTMSLAVALSKAISHHQAGRLAEAEHLYRAILHAQSEHSDANHNLGVLAMQRHQPGLALPHFKAALEANPNQRQYWLSYIEALIQAGKFDAARQVLGQGRPQGLQGETVEMLAKQLAQGNEVKAKLPIPAPTVEETTSLVFLFNQGRYQEAETHARALTRRFPGHGISWKVLGATLKRLGRLEEALGSLWEAVVLLPTDAEVHSNLGLALKEQGRLAEAETSYRRALELSPGCADNYSTLGVILQEQGRLSEAEQSCRRALAFDPDFAGAYYNLGNVLNEQGRLLEAETSYRRALDLKPDFVEAYSNLGATLTKLGDLDQAVAAYEKVIYYKPDMAETYKNLGEVFQFMDREEDELRAYQKALAIDPNDVGLDAAVWLAIRYYLAGNAERFRSMLLASQPLLATTDAKHKISRTYRQYLGLLLDWHIDSNRGASSFKEMELIQVVGESHSLSAQGVVVHYRGQEMRCVAQWIGGCKQWHLGNGRRNRFKHKFEVIMGKLPRRSTVLLTIGEIDCRLDEGIIIAWKKSPEKSLEEVAQATAESYVRYLIGVVAEYGHRLIVGGVPAVNIQSEPLTMDVDKQYVYLIQMFNAFLKELVLAAGLDFLDVHALTDRGDGIADGRWHLDGKHLLPSAMVEVFGRHCLQINDST